MKIKRIRKVSIILCMLLLALSFSPPDISVAKKTNDTIRDLENQIAQAEREKENLKATQNNLKDKLDSLQDENADLKVDLRELDDNIVEVENVIADLDAQIEAKVAEIDAIKAELAITSQELAVTTEELAVAIEISNKQYDDMVQRIRFMYENGQSVYIECFLQSDSFSDFLTKAEYIGQITEYDRMKLDEYIATQEEVALRKSLLETQESLLETQESLLEAQESALEEARATQEANKATLDAMRDLKQQEINANQSNISAAEQEIKANEEELAAMTETIKALEKALEEEEQKLLYDGGAFIWPVAKYTRITSPFGWRNHPTLHVPMFHNGIDIGSPYGTAIYAAYDGKVIASSYTSVMGYYIMIDHGGGIITVYMHCSKLHVKAGTMVTCGQKIAAVGSTGRSTGNHLHFSVRKNGEYVNPLDFVKEP